MSFESFYKECLECDLYQVGDGQSTISRCSVEDGQEPPKNCPVNHNTNERYKLTDKVLSTIVESLDDTAGFLIKESTLRYWIEKIVNEDRDKKG